MLKQNLRNEVCLSKAGSIKKFITNIYVSNPHITIKIFTYKSIYL